MEEVEVFQQPVQEEENVEVEEVEVFEQMEERPGGTGGVFSVWERC